MKIDTAAIIKEYHAKQKSYESLADDVNYLLRKLIQKQKIKIHSISYRIKEINSLIDKIRRNKIVNPFEKIHDLLGFRVVCLFLSDLKKVGDAIKTEFDVFDEDDKINEAEPNIFGYLSLHLKAKLKSSSTIKSGQNIYDMTFEIQVRTIAQDAWASISHHLDYKTSVIPKELKRDFYALSGLFYVADTHFSFIKQEQSKQFFSNNRET